jgi:hypothetical protein
MNILMIINGSAYGLDSTFNAIRLPPTWPSARTSR